MVESAVLESLLDRFFYELRVITDETPSPKLGQSHRILHGINCPSEGWVFLSCWGGKVANRLGDVGFFNLGSGNNASESTSEKPRNILMTGKYYAPGKIRPESGKLAKDEGVEA
jgi:hypothetical protein